MASPSPVKPVMWALVLRIGTIGINIPIWLILIIGVWVHFDKSQTVRKAVLNLIVGAELEAAQAKVHALEQINAEIRGRAAALDVANTRFADNLEQAQTDLENANGQLSELLSTPVNKSCIVDHSLFEQLRNN
jgi:hypothetical protein